jgi:hypothetical protein
MIFNVGYTLGNFNENSAHVEESSSWPTPSFLEILAHSLKYSSVQKYLAKQSNIQSLAKHLLRILDGTNYPFVQEILMGLAQHNSDLADRLLKLLFAKKSTSYHANLAGKIASLKDSKLQQRIKQLRDFVFAELCEQTNSKTFSSNLVPFINALSYAISRHLYGSIVTVSLNKEELLLLLHWAGSTLQGSLMQESSLALLSTLIQLDDSIYKVICTIQILIDANLLGNA